GVLAERSGFGRETIRFYERRGLLLASRRSEAGYRLYDHEAVIRLEFIAHAKLLGFTLHDIRGFIGLTVEDPASCSSVLDQVEVKLQQVRERMGALRRIEKQLSALRATCRRTGGAERCSFLSSSS
ncbi:MAG: MerR family transcriptional regulator, partial [Spirochaetia bacterium]